jgi:hypothetical protein
MKGAATLTIAEMPITAIPHAVRPDTEVLGMGPLIATMTGGLMAIGPFVTSCDSIKGVLSLTPCTIAGRTLVTLQFDAVHDHQDFRVASSFALEVADMERLLERLKHPVELARFEKGDAQ